MKNTDEDKVIIKEALDDIKEEGTGLKREVAQASAELRDADQKLQMSSGELKECNT